MTSIAKKSIATVFAGTVLATGFATPASAQPVIADGLVNVVVGDITIEDAVDLNAAVAAALNACDLVDVGPVAAGVLGQAIAVDRTGRSRTVCESATGPVRIENN
ncbi:hypothetical protein E4P39_01255 [Blastococcus sp. CT_GayMR19]|uniref:hypothetical protein n=1 Tax=Blastococcus sp. CT_GayMR19 TaxID=2559608 RepID=UPI00107334A1|nr:hypothetical protein [Blastococcus sp. CT_GayMR19]TFV79306.1 hypothetical protein E4P39_01255 [Blastococcus sp. CT_GayMR19]